MAYASMGGGWIGASDQSVELAKKLETTFTSFYNGAYKDIENYINRSAELWEGDAANEAISRARQYMNELKFQGERTLEAAKQISSSVDSVRADVEKSASMFNSLEV